MLCFSPLWLLFLNCLTSSVLPKFWSIKSNCNTISGLIRLTCIIKKDKTNFLLLDAISGCFKEILASYIFQHWIFFWSFTVDSVWFTSHAGVKKKPFYASVKLTFEQKKLHRLEIVNTHWVFACVLLLFVKCSIWLSFFNFRHWISVIF